MKMLHPGEAVLVREKVKLLKIDDHFFGPKSVYRFRSLFTHIPTGIDEIKYLAVGHMKYAMGLHRRIFSYLIIEHFYPVRILYICPSSIKCPIAPGRSHSCQKTWTGRSDMWHLLARFLPSCRANPNDTPWELCAISC
jgi:hypothetical protein